MVLFFLLGILVFTIICQLLFSISKCSENLVKVSSERSAKSVKPVDIKGHRYSDKFDNSFIEILCVTNNTSVH